MSRTLQRSVLRATIGAFAISLVAGVLFNWWYAASLRTAATKDTREHLMVVANAVSAAVGRHVSRMSVMSAYLESRRDAAQLDQEFAPFASGLIANAPGIRAIQIVRDGRIVRVYPDSSNMGALGMSLRESDQRSVREGYRRAMKKDSVTLHGPAGLVQGGVALVIDRPVHARFDPKIDFVAMLVSMDAIIAEIHDAQALDSATAFAVYDRAGKLVEQSVPRLPDKPERVTAPVTDGDWTVEGAPLHGWDAAIAPSMLPVRVAIVVIVLLITALTWQIAGRNARLVQEVESRTKSLMQMVDERTATIEQQKATERALAASEERLRRALRASLTATYEIDTATGEMVWSEGVGHVVGRDPSGTPDSFEESISYLEPEDAKRAAVIFGNAAKAPSQGAVEMRGVRADGSRVWLMFTWLSSVDPDGVIRRVVGTMTDISERKNLEEQFLHAQKMQAMGALAGGVAHDFNNLLTVILGAGQMARSAADATGVADAIRTDLDEVIAASERASVLTGQLLAFSRRQVVQPKHFDACDLVGGMGTMLRRLVGERIRVETALPGTRVPLFADQGQLTQVVMNLAVNARDAMPHGGVLRISLRTADAPTGQGLPNEVLAANQFAVISVSDDGAGIDPQIRPLIFDPFFTTKPVGQGTGLGLATVYGIVIQLGGTIRVISEVGKGSTFDVYVPLADGEADDVPVAVSVPNTRDGEGRVILLAEDEPGLRKVIERSLRNAGYELLLAEDGASALAIARAYEGHIDLLVSDVVMPGMDGAELATALRAERPTTRVLLMSGYPHGPGQEISATVTAFPLVAKPFKPSDLLAAARRVFADA